VLPCHRHAQLRWCLAQLRASDRSIRTAAAEAVAAVASALHDAASAEAVAVAAAVAEGLRSDALEHVLAALHVVTNAMYSHDVGGSV